MLGAAEMVVKREHSSHLNKTLGPFLAYAGCATFASKLGSATC